MNLPEVIQFFDGHVKSGNGYHANCPMPNHNDSTPSVSVTQDVETGKIMLYCWGCDTKAPELVQALGIRLSDLFGDPGHPAAVKMAESQVEISAEDLAALENRIKVATDYLELATDYIRTKFGLSVEDGKALGLGVDDDFGVDHLIVPFHNPSGKTVGMQGRRLVDGDPRWRSVSGPGWSKIGAFGWNFDGPVIITEGPSDALAVVGRANLPSLAVRGASNTSQQVVDQIREWLNGRSAIVIGDNDDAGEKFAKGISEGVGCGSWTLPSEYGDLCDFLAAGNSLDEAVLLASEPVPEKSNDELLSDFKTRIFNNLTRAHLDTELVSELHHTRPELLEALWIEVPAEAARHGCRVGDTRAAVRLIQSAIQNLNPPPVRGGGNGGHGNHAPPRAGDDNLPTVIWNVEDQLLSTEDEVRSALDQYDQGEFYQAARGDYVKVIKEDLQPLDDPGVKSMLSSMAHWRVIQGQRELGHPPQDAVRMVTSHSWDCDLPLIKRRVEVPFMLPNGDIVSEPGFHEDSGIYLLPREKIVVPEVPLFVTDQDVEKARSILSDVVEGFVFKNEASRTNLIAMTLTSPLRELFRDNPMVPLLTSTAPQSGSGKGTSIRVPLSTAGVGPHFLSTTAYNADENEFEKKLVAKLLKKSTFIFLDNIRTQVNSAVLEQMLTAANYDGRTLGHSEVNSLSTLVLWVCTLQSTGSFNRDLTRRCVPVELIKNWKGVWAHKNIDSYLADMRGDLIWACFVVARKWIQDGKPISNVRLDGYGGWTEVIGGIIEHVLGYEGLLDNLSSFRKTQDEISVTIDGILERWLSHYGEEAHPARMAVDDAEDPGLHQLLGLRNPSPRQVTSALERLLTSQEGYIVGNTHAWECVGNVTYKHEGMKKLFRCIPLED